MRRFRGDVTVLVEVVVLWLIDYTDHPGFKLQISDGNMITFQMTVMKMTTLNNRQIGRGMKSMAIYLSNSKSLSNIYRSVLTT
jgi:hypothetical protein